MLRLSVSDWKWPMPEDESVVTTLQCKSCGATWPVTEENPEQPEHVTRTDTYRCANCGKATVFEVNVSKISRRQG
jgi:uncharacterized Zn finger protein